MIYVEKRAGGCGSNLPQMGWNVMAYQQNQALRFPLGSHSRPLAFREKVDHLLCVSDEELPLNSDGMN